MTFVARRECRCWLRARRHLAPRSSEIGVLMAQESTPWAQGTESKHTRMITSGRAFDPIDEPSPPAAPRPARWTPRGTRSACASRRLALSGWCRSRSSRRLYWARTLAFRRLTHAPLGVWYAHEYLVHMPPATLKGQLPARRTDGTLAHDYLLGSSLEIHDIHAITTRDSRIYNSFRSSFLAPVWAVLMKPNHDPSYLAGGHKNPDMRGRRRMSVAESISLSGAR